MEPEDRGGVPWGGNSDFIYRDPIRDVLDNLRSAPRPAFWGVGCGRECVGSFDGAGIAKKLHWI